MSDELYDMVIVGSGSGGAEAAMLASRRNARVLLVDKNGVGGGAIHGGTFAMRSLMASERTLREARRKGYGGDEGVARLSDWVQRQQRIVARLTSQLEGNLMGAQVEVVRGHASLLGGGQVRVAVCNGDGASQPVERIVSARHIILATGSSPRESAQSWSGTAIGNSRRFMSLTETPDRLIIIGGGHIGCEFACIYSALGTEVTLIEKGDRLLPEMDREAGERILTAFQSRGICVRLNEEARPVWGQTSSEFAVAGLLGDGEEIFADNILLATGRTPNVLELGLDEAGVRLNAQGFIAVDECLRTTAPGVFAIGDVNGLCTLSDAAKMQAQFAVENAFGVETPFDEMDMPRCVRMDPPVAAVGALEQEARAAGRAVRTATVDLPPLPDARSGGQVGLLKLVVDADTGELIGAMIIDGQAPAWINEIRAAMRMKGSLDHLLSACMWDGALTAAIQECVGAILRDCGTLQPHGRPAPGDPLRAPPTPRRMVS